MTLRRLRLAIPLALIFFLADCASKDLAELYLVPEHLAHPVVGNVVRFTLAYNDGAAMNLPVGPYARWPLIILSIVAAGVIVRLIWVTPTNATIRRIGLGLLLGGTLGNLISRVSSHRGVVDFIDIGFGSRRFYVFNVADVGITFGVCLLALTMRAAQRAQATAPVPAHSESDPPPA